MSLLNVMWCVHEVKVVNKERREICSSCASALWQSQALNTEQTKRLNGDPSEKIGICVRYGMQFSNLELNEQMKI